MVQVVEILPRGKNDLLIDSQYHFYWKQHYWPVKIWYIYQVKKDMLFIKGFHYWDTFHKQLIT